jgi:hypothetical protein
MSGARANPTEAEKEAVTGNEEVATSTAASAWA